MKSRLRTLKSWAEFEKLLEGYFAHAPSRRDQFVFRGHSDSKWELQATLDRKPYRRDSDVARNELLDKLLARFTRECVGLVTYSELPDTPRQWELLGRHHGLPTTILDWTLSPYVAAFFAFVGAKATPAGSVAIWVFDKKLFADRDSPDTGDAIEIWDESDDYRYNPRAVEQHAVFMKVHDMSFASSPSAAPYLTKFEIPGHERRRVLDRLHAMKVDARSLFRTLDSAAATAALSLEVESTNG